MTAIPDFARPAAVRALVIGEMGADRRMASLTQGWRECGWDVAEIDFTRFFAAGSGPLVGLSDRLFGSFHKRTLRQAIRDRIRQDAFDIVVFVKAAGADADLLKDIRRTGAKSIAWYPDCTFDQAIVDPSAFADFDLFFTTKRFQVEYLEQRLGKRRVFHSDHGYLPCVHRRYDPPLDDGDKTIDCVAIGNHSDHKQHWIERIAAAAPDITFTVCGGRWNTSAHAYGTNVVVLAPRHGDFFSRLLNHARIALALHHGPCGSEGWEDAVSARSFEYPACGTFMLHQDNPEIRRSYEVGEEIVVFSTPEEAAEKTRYYLGHPAERETIAEAGWRRAVPAYALTRRAKSMAKEIETFLAAAE